MRCLAAASDSSAAESRPGASTTTWPGLPLARMPYHAWKSFWEMGSNLWSWQRAQETVRARKALERTSTWLSTTFTWSSRASTGM